MLNGRILAESLRIGCDLQVRDLRISRIDRRDVSSGAASYQPRVWTLLDIEGPDDIADDLAAALSEALVDGHGWYADFRVGADHVVVYRGRTFRYAVGDEAGRREAADYGRSVGVPSHQLDYGRAAPARPRAGCGRAGCARRRRGGARAPGGHGVPFGTRTAWRPLTSRECTGRCPDRAVCTELMALTSGHSSPIKITLD